VKSSHFMKQLLLLSVGILLCYGLYKFTKITIDEMLQRLFALPYHYISAFVVLNFIYHYVRSQRWGYLSRLMYPSLSFSRGFYICHQLMSLGTLFLSASGSGVLLRMIAQKIEGGVSLKGVAAILVLESLLSLMILALMTTGIIAYYAGNLGMSSAFLISLVTCISAMTFMVLWHKQLIDHLASLCRHFAALSGRLRLLIHAGSRDGQSAIHRADFLNLSLLSIVIYFIPPIYYYTFILALDINISLLQLVVIFPLVYLAGYLSFTPFGIGVREVGNAGALLALGVPNDEALLFAVAIRVFGDMSNIGLALSGYLIWLKLRNWQSG
jgi:uncharacterized protein (TIRG00374 family)